MMREQKILPRISCNSFEFFFTYLFCKCTLQFLSTVENKKLLEEILECNFISQLWNI